MTCPKLTSTTSDGLFQKYLNTSQMRASFGGMKHHGKSFEDFSWTKSVNCAINGGFLVCKIISLGSICLGPEVVSKITYTKNICLRSEPVSKTICLKDICLSSEVVSRVACLENLCLGFEPVSKILTLKTYVWSLKRCLKTIVSRRHVWHPSHSFATLLDLKSLNSSRMSVLPFFGIEHSHVLWFQNL